MKKTVCLIISAIMLILSVLSILCAIIVTGSGFLDLSNIARGAFICIGLILGLISVLTYLKARKM